MSGARPRLRDVEPVPVPTPDGEMYYLKDPAGLADEIAVSPMAMWILAMMNGERDLTEIQLEFERRSGQPLARDVLEALVDQLDARHLLDSPAFAAHATALEAAFLAAPVRPAAFAGMCYPAEADLIVRQFDNYYTQGPGQLARSTGPGACALIAPHIDPPRGGPAYAHAYHALDGAPPELVIVLGTSHVPTGALLTFTRKDYETPLGAARTDADAMARLEARFGRALYTGEARHRSEHSIEFQMLFLKHRWPDAPFTTLPILCGSPHEALARGEPPEAEADYEPLVDALAGIAAERRTLIIASADLAHVGPQFGDPQPIDDPARAALEGTDRAMLAPVLSRDRHAFRKAVWDDQDRTRICGFMPIYTTLALLERLGHAANGDLLDYRQWPDPRAVVTYTAIAFR